MRAVAKRKAWVEGEDREHNQVLLLFRKSITSSYYNESFGSNSYYKYSKQHKKKKNNNFILPKFEKAGIVTSLLDITTRVNIRKIRHSVPGCGGHVCFSCH